MLTVSPQQGTSLIGYTGSVNNQSMNHGGEGDRGGYGRRDNPSPWSLVGSKLIVWST